MFATFFVRPYFLAYFLYALHHCHLTIFFFIIISIIIIVVVLVLMPYVHICFNFSVYYWLNFEAHTHTHSWLVCTMFPYPHITHRSTVHLCAHTLPCPRRLLLLLNHFIVYSHFFIHSNALRVAPFTVFTCLFSTSSSPSLAPWFVPFDFCVCVSVFTLMPQSQNCHLNVHLVVVAVVVVVVVVITSVLGLICDQANLSSFDSFSHSSRLPFPIGMSRHHLCHHHHHHHHQHHLPTTAAILSTPSSPLLTLWALRATGIHLWIVNPFANFVSFFR